MARAERWGILGTAEISKQVMRGIRAAGGELRAVASRDEAKARRWAAEHGIPLAFGSYEELLASGEVELIYNPLPNSLHAAWTIRALEAGHAVLCEKPLAVDAAQARTMAAAAARCGRHLAEAFMYRFHPQWDVVRGLIEQGEIGAVTTMHAQFTFMLDDPTGNAGSAALAGGALRDVGCYGVHFARTIAGCEPLYASAFARWGEVDEVMVGLLEFPGGVLAHLETSIANFERHRAEIAGTKGAIVLDQPWVPGDAPAVVRLFREGRPTETIAAPAADAYRLEVEDFMAVCAGTTSPRWPVADAVANMVVLDALAKSARERRSVAVSNGE